jgi:hypothetical protein
MQRWIAASVLVLMLMLGGAYVYYKKVYQPNLPHPVWVPMPINPELPSAKVQEIMTELKKKLSQPEILVKVSSDLGLVKKWDLPSDEICAKEIADRLFIRTGDADTPMGKVPAIHIGVNGKSKESALSGELAMRLMQDVWKILGIKPPKQPSARDTSYTPDHF